MARLPAEPLGLRRSSADLRRASIGALIAGTAPHDAMSAPDRRYRIVEDIVDLVEAECARAPVVLGLEDVHWAGSSTLLAIRTIAHELVHLPLLVVATMRPSPRSAELNQIIDDLLSVGARSITLQPLPPDEVDTLVRTELGVPAGPELAALVAKAAGNPLWAVEFLRSLSAEGVLHRGEDVAEITSTELPDSLRELVVRRLHDLPQATLDLLQVTAVLGDATSISDLVAVTRRPATDLVSTLREAFRAHLLGEDGGSVTFRHRLVHDAIYQSMPEPVRSAAARSRGW